MFLYQPDRAYVHGFLPKDIWGGGAVCPEIQFNFDKDNIVLILHQDTCHQSSPMPIPIKFTSAKKFKLSLSIFVEIMVLQLNPIKK